MKGFRQNLKVVTYYLVDLPNSLEVSTLFDCAPRLELLDLSNNQVK